MRIRAPKRTFVDPMGYHSLHAPLPASPDRHLLQPLDFHDSEAMVAVVIAEPRGARVHLTFNGAGRDV